MNKTRKDTKKIRSFARYQDNVVGIDSNIIYFGNGTTYYQFSAFDL